MTATRFLICTATSFIFLHPSSMVTMDTRDQASVLSSAPIEEQITTFQNMSAQAITCAYQIRMLCRRPDIEKQKKEAAIGTAMYRFNYEKNLIQEARQIPGITLDQKSQLIDCADRYKDAIDLLNQIIITH